MQPSTIPVTTLLYLFFFVVPGFLTFRLVIFFGKVSFDFDRFDKTAISVAISGLTLLAPYFLYLEPRIENIEAATLGQLGITFALDVAIACGLGLVIGILYDRFIRPEQVYRPQLWINTMREMRDGVQVTVVTTSEATIRGHLKGYDRIEDSPTLLLEDAQIVTGNVGVEEQGTVYISGDDISQIWFQKVPGPGFFEQPEDRSSSPE